MKKIKMLAATAMFCATAFAGYTAYEQATMTAEEKLFQANLEALTNDETDATTQICLALWGNCIDDVKAPYAKVEF